MILAPGKQKPKPWTHYLGCITRIEWTLISLSFIAAFAAFAGLAPATLAGKFVLGSIPAFLVASLTLDSLIGLRRVAGDDTGRNPKPDWRVVLCGRILTTTGTVPDDRSALDRTHVIRITDARLADAKLQILMRPDLMLSCATRQTINLIGVLIRLTGLYLRYFVDLIIGLLFVALLIDPGLPGHTIDYLKSNPEQTTIPLKALLTLYSPFFLAALIMGGIRFDRDLGYKNYLDRMSRARTLKAEGLAIKPQNIPPHQ